jgi:hypothetical protein
LLRNSLNSDFQADFDGDQMAVHLSYWSDQAIIPSFIEHRCSWLRRSNGITITYIKVYGIDDDDVENFDNYIDIDNYDYGNVTTNHQNSI